MNIVQKCGTYLLFFSLPAIAALKGKGTVGLLILAFLLFGLLEVPRFFKEKEWKKMLPLTPQKIYFWLGALGIWMFASIFWSQDIFLELGHFAKFLALIILSFFTYFGIKKLPSKDKIFFSKAFFYGFTFYILFYAIEIYGGGLASKALTNSNGYNRDLFLRGVIILTLFLVPFSLLLPRLLTNKKALWTGGSLLFLVSTAILLRAHPSAAALAAIVGIVSFSLVYWKKSFGPLIGVFIGALTLFSPVIFVYFINEQTLLNYMHYLGTSAQHRLQLWHDLSLKILNSPFLGYGFNFSPYVTGGRFRAAYYSKKTLLNGPLSAAHSVIEDGIVPQSWGSIVYYGDSVFGRHPHNGFIQVWLEFGLVGVMLLLGLGYAFVRLLSQIQNREARSASFALFFMYVVFWSISFGIWQNWMIAMVALTIILFKVIKDLPKKIGR